MARCSFGPSEALLTGNFKTANEVISSIVGVMSFKIYQQPGNMKAGHNLYDLYHSLKDDTKELAGMIEIIAVGENIVDQSLSADFKDFSPADSI